MSDEASQRTRLDDCARRRHSESDFNRQDDSQISRCESSDNDHPGPLKITSLAMVGEKLYAGTQSRGILLIENGEAKEVVSKPRSFFVNALETDGQGRLWVGARARLEEGGLLDSGEP